MEKKKIKVYLSIAYIVLLFTYAGIDFYISDKKADKVFKYLEEHYKTLRVNDSLNNTVISIYKFPESIPVRGYGNLKYVELDNHKKYEIYADEVLSNAWLEDILHVGSRLIKRPGSDTLIVVTYGRRYLFIISEDVP